MINKLLKSIIMVSLFTFLFACEFNGTGEEDKSSPQTVSGAITSFELELPEKSEVTYDDNISVTINYAIRSYSADNTYKVCINFLGTDEEGKTDTKLFEMTGTGDPISEENGSGDYTFSLNKISSINSSTFTLQKPLKFFISLSERYSCFSWYWYYHKGTTKDITYILNDN